VEQIFNVLNKHNIRVELVGRGLDRGLCSKLHLRSPCFYLQIHTRLQEAQREEGTCRVFDYATKVGSNRDTKTPSINIVRLWFKKNSFACLSFEEPLWEEWLQECNVPDMVQAIKDDPKIGIFSWVKHTEFRLLRAHQSHGISASPSPPNTCNNVIEKRVGGATILSCINVGRREPRLSLRFLEWMHPHHHHIDNKRGEDFMWWWWNIERVDTELS